MAPNRRCAWSRRNHLEPTPRPAARTAPPPRRVPDLSGTWRTSLGSLWQLTRTDESQYAIVEFNLFGATGASGAGAVSGNALEARVGVPFLLELRCYLTIADSSTMQGTCGGAVGNLSITLTR